MKRLRLRRSWWLSAGIASVCLWGATGCDTVALVSFQEREFSQIESPGFTATAGSCGAIEDGEATLRFVLLADDQSSIRPGEVVGKETIDTITADDLELNNSALFELPDLPCASNDDCRLAEMTCAVGPNVVESGNMDRCLKTSTVSLSGPVQFESDVTNAQLFGVMYENSGSLQGWLPSDVGALYPDWDNDGTADGGQDPGVVRGRASDQTNSSKAALTILVTNFLQAAENALNEQRPTQFGLWQFSGNDVSGVNSLVNEVTPGDTVWMSSPGAESLRNSFDQITGTRANVYQAALEVLETGYAPAEYEAYEKTLVLFVDGPDDLRLPQFSAQAVIERATELGVRIFIVHLDSAQDLTTSAGDTQLHRDDPQYWRNRVDGEQIQTPCADGSECRNFESCVVPIGYASTSGGSVEIETDDTYCMPRRNELGRLGPIDEYARIACATDGGYIYVKHPSALRSRMKWLPHTMDGLWKVNVRIDDLANSTVPSGEGYKLQTSVTATVGGRNDTFSFSQSGEAATDDDAQDTRSVIFN